MWQCHVVACRPIRHFSPVKRAVLVMSRTGVVRYSALSVLTGSQEENRLKVDNDFVQSHWSASGGVRHEIRLKSGKCARSSQSITIGSNQVISGD